jgi:hypothetical protein
MTRKTYNSLKNYFLQYQIYTFCKYLVLFKSKKNYLISAECNKCTGFTSSLLCGCGVPISEHKMTVETGDEREIRRKAHKQSLS